MAPLARLLVVTAVFAFALLLLLPIIDVAQRTFALPALFGRLATGMLVAIWLLALVVAWRYPRLGVDAAREGEGPEGRR